MADSTKAKELADELGLHLARYYLVIERVIRQSVAERSKLKQSASQLLESMSDDEIRNYLASHQALVGQGFRDALTGPLRREAEELLGFTHADFEHIVKNTPGNPDIGVGVVSQPTGNGNTLYGPAVTVTERHVTMKLGGGVEVAPPTDSGGLGDAARKAIKGVGVMISVTIEC